MALFARHLRAVTARALQVRAAGSVTASGDHAAHGPVGGPPPVTCDDLPIPFKPFKQEYERTNKKFNTLLTVSTVCFVATLVLVRFATNELHQQTHHYIQCFADDSFEWQASSPPFALTKRTQPPGM